MQSNQLQIQQQKDLIIEKCFEKFTTNPKSRDELEKFLIDDKKILKSHDEFLEFLKSKEIFNEFFNQLSLFDLSMICDNEQIDIETEKSAIIATVKPKRFYKVEFDEKLIPKITALGDQEIWDKAIGLDRSRDFIINNSGNWDRLSLFGHAFMDNLDIEKAVATEVKILEKCLRENQDSNQESQSRQYLVTVNEFYNKKNFDLIKDHNSKTDDELRQYSTEYAKEQARLIFGPLIFDKDGKKLDDLAIKNNFSKVIAYNPSFGTFAMNCQINSLVAIMKEADIEAKTIKESIESIHRFDAPNMVKIQFSSDKFPAASATVFQAQNDRLAIDFGAKLPEEFLLQTETQKGNILVISTPAPIEVYNPAKRIEDKETGNKREPNKGEYQEEERLFRGLSELKTLEQIKLIGDKKRLVDEQYSEVQSQNLSFPKTVFARIKSRNLAKKITEADQEAKDNQKQRINNALRDLDLHDFRYSDPNIHNRPHVIGIATPGNEVAGRDRNLLFKKMLGRINVTSRSI